MKAVISMIGWSVGLDYDVVNKRDIIPHFTWEQAKEMVDSGVIEFQTHSFGLHDVQTDKDARLGILQKSGEATLDYLKLIESDLNTMQTVMSEKLEIRPFIFTYPYGYYNAHTEGLISENGFLGSVTVDEGMNLITKDPNSLYLLKRFDASAWLSSEDILEKIDPVE